MTALAFRCAPASAPAGEPFCGAELQLWQQRPRIGIAKTRRRRSALACFVATRRRRLSLPLGDEGFSCCELARVLSTQARPLAWQKLRTSVRMLLPVTELASRLGVDTLGRADDPNDLRALAQRAHGCRGAPGCVSQSPPSGREAACRPDPRELVGNAEIGC